MDFTPIKTGKVTSEGRPLWQNPINKELYSEKSVTIPLSIDPKTGDPKPGTKWVNVPSVFDGGKIIDNEDFLMKFYKENGYKDPITGRKLEFFSSSDEAVSSAKARSESITY